MSLQESISVVPSSQIDGSLSRARKKTSGCLFGEVAKVVWDKPDAVLADICDVSDRAARDYLNGKVAAPGAAIAALIVEITKRS